LLGGLTIFVPLIVAIAIVGGRAAKGVYKPGLFTTNRVAGAALGAALALCVVAVGLMAVRTQPLPFGVDRLVQRSPLGQQIVDWVAPVVRTTNIALDLGLCRGKFAKRIPEVCAVSLVR
jgi:Na+-translocating ferredoxin:NAD+ oxidoreductase RnfE subunit